MATRDRIVQAANVVALRDGVLNLTLEAVAQEAGLSKGGLLYHFPNKEALVAGLVAHFTDEFEAMLNDEIDAQDTGRGSFTRAFVDATFGPYPAPPRLNAALLAAVALNPKLLEGLQAKFQSWHERLQNDGLDPTLASLLGYAADGIWMSELLGLAPPNEDLRKRLHRLMMDLSQGGTIP